MSFSFFRWALSYRSDNRKDSLVALHKILEAPLKQNGSVKMEGGGGSCWAEDSYHRYPYVSFLGKADRSVGWM